MNKEEEKKEEENRMIQEAVESIETNLKEVKQGLAKYRYSLSDYISVKLDKIRTAVDTIGKYY